MMNFKPRKAKKGPKPGAGPAVVLAVLWLTIPARAALQTAPAEPKFGPLEKSLLLPGWGQLSEGRIVKGAAMLAAELACLAGAIYHNGRGNEAYNLYKGATDAASASRYRGLVERHDGRRNAFLLAAAAVWTVNLIDIFSIVRNKSLSLGISHAAPREIRLSLGYHF